MGESRLVFGPREEAHGRRRLRVDRAVDRVENFGEVRRAKRERLGTDVAPEDAVILVHEVRRHEDDRNPDERGLRADSRTQLEPVQVRHEDIRQDQRRGLFDRQGQGLTFVKASPRPVPGHRFEAEASSC
jgi:hypothetical protein